MNIKTLLDQHDRFAARQAAKDARAKAKAEAAADWLLTKEAWRKRREQTERAADLRQQQRLEDDPDYVAGRF